MFAKYCKMWNYRASIVLIGLSNELLLCMCVTITSAGCTLRGRRRHYWSCTSHRYAKKTTNIRVLEVSTVTSLRKLYSYNHSVSQLGNRKHLYEERAVGGTWSNNSVSVLVVIKYKYIPISSHLKLVIYILGTSLSARSLCAYLEVIWYLINLTAFATRDRTDWFRICSVFLFVPFGPRCDKYYTSEILFFVFPLCVSLVVVGDLLRHVTWRHAWQTPPGVVLNEAGALV
jgi:hypothetical protein